MNSSSAVVAGSMQRKAAETGERFGKRTRAVGGKRASAGNARPPNRVRRGRVRGRQIVRTCYRVATTMAVDWLEAATVYAPNPRKLSRVRNPSRQVSSFFLFRDLCELPRFHCKPL